MKNPYAGIENEQRYSKASKTPISQHHLLASPKTVSLGSCFAEHIMAELHKKCATPIFPGLKRINQNHSGRFDALRSGNLYTPRQIFELLQETLTQNIRELIFQDKNLLLFDGLRPGVIENSWAAKENCIAARKLYLKNLLLRLHEADQVILTFGLVENWVHSKSGYAVPALPSIRGSSENLTNFHFDKENLTSLVKNIGASIEMINKLNNKCSVTVTVSPVPMIASMQPKHVTVSNCASKSSLRAAIDFLEDTKSLNFKYFPSYEIVTTNTVGDYFLKTPPHHGVTSEGVSKVMSCAFAPFESEVLVDKFDEDPDEVICEEYLQAHAEIE